MSVLQVKMVQQQEMKTYELLSSHSFTFYANDPHAAKMWYIVSVIHKFVAGHLQFWKEEVG